MTQRSRIRQSIRLSLIPVALFSLVAVLNAFAGRSSALSGDVGSAHPDETPGMQEVQRGRQLVLEHACSGCHGGVFTPDAEGWLAGVRESRPDLEFLIGRCAMEPGAEPCFRTRARNVTPDNLTGIGRFTERQIFNALRYGLRPGETPDVDITSTTPGQGNFPLHPKYMGPPMPWTAWRHMPDEDLRAIAAYLRQGVKPVPNRVPDSEGPPDFWASGYADFLSANPRPAPPFPTNNERAAGPGVDAEKVLRGRQVVIQHDCGACHGGATNPANEGWLQGVRNPDADAFPVGLAGQKPISGPCSMQPATTACWMMRPANLTPHATSGIGRYTDRQLFNALRYGLRPATTPDVEITSGLPGMGNFPAKPDFLGSTRLPPGRVSYLRAARSPACRSPSAT
jgi:mono/diheme cytochrome c family protein